ncbi:unnamed protein product [Fusarium graminearum]|uniref:Uncharacterized protein n=1 Tax=Gibberella zeae TaxID=5518 RepID=A0A9N8RP74_GIBZA|nr:unnamed protein product [Fusarium graminearum]
MKRIKILKIYDNSQVTNALSTLVGTSEAIRYASLEITMDIRDECALQAVKNVYGGSIKLRSGWNLRDYMRQY